MKFKLLNVFLFLAVPFCVSGMSKDTSCAVVLYSGAKYTKEAKFINFAVRKAYHKKIQILTQEGLKYSFVDIPYHIFMEYSETVGGIQVSVTDADGGNMRVIVQISGLFYQWWQQMCSMFDEMIVLRSKGGKSFTDTEKITA